MARTTRHSLIDAVQSPDAPARAEGWDRLWTVYGQYVIYRIERTGASANDVDDISQDVFNSVAQRIGDFKPGARTGSFRAWLGVIVRHRVADFYRRQDKCVGAGEPSGRTNALDLVADQASIDEDDPAESGQVRQIYERALELARAEFEEETVKMFREAVAEGRATSDIAASHGVSAAAVRMAKSRVLRRLRELLGEIDPAAD